jgi:hypothetical protein
MLATIQLYHQGMFQAEEIDNVTADRCWRRNLAQQSCRARSFIQILCSASV